MKLEALSPLEAGLKKTPSKSTTAPAKVKLFSACQGPKQGFHDSACHACVPCPHPHMHRKGRRLAKAPQVTRCTCPNTLCDWHGKCRECVALHRYHKSHVPFCLQFITKDRVQTLAATVEMETVPVQPTPWNTDSTCLSATGNARLWQKTATSSQPQRRKRMRGARGRGSSPLARR